MGGLSLILVEKTMPGVKTRHMPCSGVWASGTTYVTFEDVKVPVENIIGQENKGFKAIMYDFHLLEIKNNSIGSILIMKEWESVFRRPDLLEFAMKTL